MTHRKAWKEAYSLSRRGDIERASGLVALMAMLTFNVRVNADKVFRFRSTGRAITQAWTRLDERA